MATEKRPSSCCLSSTMSCVNSRRRSSPRRTRPDATSDRVGARGVYSAGRCGKVEHWDSRGHFFAARRKRCGGFSWTTRAASGAFDTVADVSEWICWMWTSPPRRRGAFLLLDDALTKLAAYGHRLPGWSAFRFFAGVTTDEAAPSWASRANRQTALVIRTGWLRREWSRRRAVESLDLRLKMRREVSKDQKKIFSEFGHSWGLISHCPVEQAFPSS